MLFQRNQMQGTAGCHLHTDGRTHPVSGVNHQVGACKWCTRVVQAPIPVVLQIVGVQLLNIHLRYKQPVYDQSGMNETTQCCAGNSHSMSKFVKECLVIDGVEGCTKVK